MYVLVQRVMQLLHHTEMAVMVYQRAERWRAISAVSLAYVVTLFVVYIIGRQCTRPYN